MSPTVNKLVYATGGLSLVFLLFMYVPMPGLEEQSISHATASPLHVEGMAFFDHILEGQSLNRPFPEIPVRPDNPTTLDKIELGRLLFFDPVLSGDNTLACATCHHPDLGFSDNRMQAMGVRGRGIGPMREGGSELRRNTPTLWNVAFNPAQFWDGRAADLEAQAAGSILDPDQMGQNPFELVEELRALPDYVLLFEKAFGETGPNAITFERVTYAISAFERTLLSQSSRFDRYAAGDPEAFSPAERRGLNLFRSVKTRCLDCHGLPTFTSPEFNIIGVPDLPRAESDPGLGALVKGFKGAFKVPTLRNIALTAPYMHNGIFRTLGEVVDFYAAGGGAGMGVQVENLNERIQPFALSPREREDLILFLQTLTDESALPEMPASVPSGLPVVPRLKNQSRELMTYNPAFTQRPAPKVKREGKRLLVEPGDLIQRAIDVATEGDTIIVQPGRYHETLSLDLSGITLFGVEENGEWPVLDGRGVLSDGLVGSGRNLEIRNFVVRDYTSNGLMIDLGKQIIFRDLRIENTGLYGIYSVEAIDVLIEQTEVTGARNAGVYIGQAKDVVVRENTLHENVTGIQVENTVNAVVERNIVYNNAGGILVLLLPNNRSKLSLGCLVRDNKIMDNNHVNFADQHAFVRNVPSGTGIMIVAADQVTVAQNEITNNRSVGVALLGLDAALGKGSRYDVDPFPERNTIAGNLIARNGEDPDPRLIKAGFAGVDLIWDLSGSGNSWDQPNATRMPQLMPGSEWSDFGRRVNKRAWHLLAATR